MRPLHFIRLFLGSLLMGLGATACASSPYAGPRPVGQVTYQYVYYPEYRLYYAPDRHIWFWPSGSNWHSGAQLPRIYQPYVRHGGITVHLFDRHPRGHHHGTVYRGADRYGQWHGNGYHPRQHGWKAPDKLHGWKDHDRWRDDRRHGRDHDHRRDGRWDGRFDGHKPERRWDDRRGGDRRGDGRHDRPREHDRLRRD